MQTLSRVLLTSFGLLLSLGGMVRADDDFLELFELFPEEKPLTEARREALQEERGEALAEAARTMLDAPAPTERFLACLTVLETGELPEWDAALDQLVRTKWPRRKGESVAAWIDRSVTEAAESESSGMRAFRVRQGAYAKVLDEPSPWPWERGRERWTALIETIDRSRMAGDPAKPFREQFERSGRDDLFCEAYLSELRASALDRIDVDFVAGFANADVGDVGRVHRRLLTSLSVARIDVPEAVRDRWENSLVVTFREIRLNEYRLEENAWPLRELFEMEFEANSDEVNPRAERHAVLLRRLVEAMVNEQEPECMLALRQIVGLPDDVVRSTFLQKPVELKATARPLGEVVGELIAEVGLPLWVEPGVLRNTTKINVDERGPWLQVARSVLAQADHVAVEVDDCVLWIGPRAERGLAERRIRMARGKARAVSGGRLDEWIHAWIEDTPTFDHFDYLDLVHDVGVFDIAKSKKPIDYRIVCTRYFALLTIICEEAGLEWIPFEDVVIVVPKDRIDEVRATIDHHRDRVVERRRMELEGRLPNGLQNVVEMSAVEWQLETVLDFQGEFNGLNVVNLTPELDKPNVSEQSAPVRMSTMLTLVLLEHGLRWETDGEVVVCGTTEDLARYRLLVETRAARRKSWGARAEKLTRRFSNDSDPDRIGPSFEALSEAANLSLPPTFEFAMSFTRNYRLRNVPLDVALDVTAVRFDAEWSVTDDGVVLEPLRRTRE